MRNKNNKGFTLIEIIISISLIALLSVITIVLINKNDKDKEKEKFLTTIESSSVVFLESIEVDGIIDNLRYPGDILYIQISELINSGLLDGELDDPFFLGTKLKDHVCEWVRAKLENDDTALLTVEYPVFNDIPVNIQRCEKLEQKVKTPTINIVDNNSEKFILYNDTETTFKNCGFDTHKSIENPGCFPFNKDSTKNLPEKVKNYHDNFTLTLRDYRGNTIKYLKENIKLENTINQNYITYKLSYNGDDYKGVKSTEYVVKFKDNSAPALIYGTDITDAEYKNKNEILEFPVVKDGEEDFKLKYNPEKSVWRYDNKDGWETYDYSNEIKLGSWSSWHEESLRKINVSIRDSANEYSNYTLMVTAGDNRNAEYSGPHDIKIGCNIGEDDCESFGYLSFIEKYIKCTDTFNMPILNYSKDNNAERYCHPAITEIITEYVNGGVLVTAGNRFEINTPDGESRDEIPEGDYYLNINCKDEYSNPDDFCGNDYPITLYKDAELEGSDDLYEVEDSGECDVYCKLEQMQDNSQECRDTSNDSCPELHEKNEDIADEIREMGYDIGYDPATGHWYLDLGNGTTVSYETFTQEEKDYVEEELGGDWEYYCSVYSDDC